MQRWIFPRFARRLSRADTVKVCGVGNAYQAEESHLGLELVRTTYYLLLTTYYLLLTTYATYQAEEGPDEDTFFI